MSHCSHCKTQSNALGACGNCMQVVYCSRQCQAADWINGHNIECVGANVQKITFETKRKTTMAASALTLARFSTLAALYSYAIADMALAIKQKKPINIQQFTKNAGLWTFRFNAVDERVDTLNGLLTAFRNAAEQYAKAAIVEKNPRRQKTLATYLHETWANNWIDLWASHVSVVSNLGPNIHAYVSAFEDMIEPLAVGDMDAYYGAANAFVTAGRRVGESLDSDVRKEFLRCNVYQ